MRLCGYPTTENPASPLSQDLKVSRISNMHAGPLDREASAARWNPSIRSRRLHRPEIRLPITGRETKVLRIRVAFLPSSPLLHVLEGRGLVVGYGLGSLPFPFPFFACFDGRGIAVRVQPPVLSLPVLRLPGITNSRCTDASFRCPSRSRRAGSGSGTAAFPFSDRSRVAGSLPRKMDRSLDRTDCPSFRLALRPSRWLEVREAGGGRSRSPLAVTSS